MAEIIACDVDDVLTPWRRIVLPHLSRHLGREVAYDDQHSPDLADCYGITPPKMVEAIDAVRSAWDNARLPLLGDARLAIRGLKREGYGLAIITSRHDGIVSDTYRWVQKHFGSAAVYFSQSAGYIYGGGDGRLTKLELTRQIGAVCLIDDNPHEFVDWPHDEIEAICYAQPWNRDVKDIDPRIHRLDWLEIYHLLLSRLRDPVRQHP